MASISSGTPPLDQEGPVWVVGVALACVAIISVPIYMVLRPLTFLTNLDRKRVSPETNDIATIAPSAANSGVFAPSEDVTEPRQTPSEKSKIYPIAYEAHEVDVKDSNVSRIGPIQYKVAKREPGSPPWVQERKGRMVIGTQSLPGNLAGTSDDGSKVGPGQGCAKVGTRNGPAVEQATGTEQAIGASDDSNSGGGSSIISGDSGNNQQHWLSRGYKKHITKKKKRVSGVEIVDTTEDSVRVVEFMKEGKRLQNVQETHEHVRKLSGGGGGPPPPNTPPPK